MEIYSPNTKERALFKAAAQKPVIDYIEKRVGNVWIGRNMLRFCANISKMFAEVDFLSRFGWASRAGFRGVECAFPYEWDKEQLAEALEKHSLEHVSYNLPCGNWAAGERGIACLPGREGEFQDGVELAVAYAKFLKCSRINCVVGLTPQGVPEEKIHHTLINNLRFAANIMGKQNIRLLVEPINNQDLPGFHLVHTNQALSLIKEVNHSNLWLLYDVYQMQIMEGNLTKTITDNLSCIAHIHIADNPGRHEPGTGEINYTNLFSFIDRAGYDGWIGCEYDPIRMTENGLTWYQPFRIK
jgi:hydroxypyruvate isomerase